MLHGNHEDRIDRFVDENPELNGTMKISDLQFKNLVGKKYHINK